MIREAARFNVLCCGRRFGKTLFGVDRIIRKPLEGYPAAWFAPNYKYLVEAWRDLKRILRPVIQRVSEQEHRLELITGGVVEAWSLEDPDAGRSRRYASVAIDEAAKVRNLEVAWNESIRATLADFRGEAWFLSTPKGMNFFWQAWTYGQDSARPEWASWQMPTGTNPYIHPDEIEAARQGMPERVFEQEFLARFLEDAGGVFRGVREVVDTGRSLAEEPRPGVSYSIGVDLARVEDFTVITALDPSRRQVFHERFNQISWERQINTIRQLADRYPGQVWLDSTGIGDPIFEALRKAGVRVNGYQFTNQSKEALIDALAMAIEHGEVRLMDIAAQFAELLAYQYELTPSRNVRMNAPAGMHDDCVIALALANWGARSSSEIRFWNL